MKKLFFLTLISLLSQPLWANETEDYISLLQWEEKWTRVTTKAADGFIERGKAYYPSSFTPSHTEQAANLIRSSIVQRIGWGAMKDTVVSGFRDNCGDDLLDIMVELHTGVPLSTKDRELVAVEYAECATVTMQSAMNEVLIKMNNFSETEKEILSTVNSN